MTTQEQSQGYAICDCATFAFVWRAEWLRWMPTGYRGELCPECGQWMCSVEKLRLAEEAKKQKGSENTDKPAGGRQSL